MSYEEHTWIYDVNGIAVEKGECPCYHAFKEPDTTSLCGKMTTTTFETKTPGAPECETCLAITGPKPECDRSEGDLVVFHALPFEQKLVTAPSTPFDFERYLEEFAARWKECYGST